MIIDLILDRKDGQDYNSREFYHEVMKYGDVGHEITRAMDEGEERDVKQALYKYIINNEYSLDICRYINKVNWL